MSKARAPEDFQTLIEKSLSSNLLLLQEVGPTGFVVKDNNCEKKYTIFIGNPPQCSCKHLTQGTCIHILFVMLKVLKMEKDDPLLWKIYLTDRDITTIIEGRYIQRSNISKLNKTSSNKKQKGMQTVSQRPIQKNDDCPICFNLLHPIDGIIPPIIFCKYSCGQSVHTYCMKSWAEHQVSMGLEVTCPLCRFDWGQQAITSLKKAIHEAEKKQQIISNSNTYCCCCSSFPIKGRRFHCAFCQVHNHHPCVLYNGNSNVWEPAFTNLSSSSLYDNYIGEISLTHFLAESLPPYIYLNYTLNEIENISCSSCHNFIKINDIKDPYSVRALFCGHFIHHACLYHDVMERFDLQCGICFQPVFQGMQSESLFPRRNPLATFKKTIYKNIPSENKNFDMEISGKSCIPSSKSPLSKIPQTAPSSLQTLSKDSFPIYNQQTKTSLSSNKNSLSLPFILKGNNISPLQLNSPDTKKHSTMSSSPSFIIPPIKSASSLNLTKPLLNSSFKHSRIAPTSNLNSKKNLNLFNTSSKNIHSCIQIVNQDHKEYLPNTTSHISSFHKIRPPPNLRDISRSKNLHFSSKIPQILPENLNSSSTLILSGSKVFCPSSFTNISSKKTTDEYSSQFLEEEPLNVQYNHHNSSSPSSTSPPSQSNSHLLFLSDPLIAGPSLKKTVLRPTKTKIKKGLTFRNRNRNVIQPLSINDIY